MKYMADNGLISSYTEKGGRKTYTVMKWFGTRSSRFVEFHIGKLAESKDPMDDAEELAEGSSRSDPEPDWHQQQFHEIDGDDSQLPF